MTETETHGQDLDVIRTVELLGKEKTLRGRVTSRLQAHDLLKKGLPTTALDHLIKGVATLRMHYSKEKLEKAVGVSVRTLQRRKQAGRLSPDQSGRVWKFAEILARASGIFGSQAEAEQWLERPAMALDQRKPIDLLSTPAGVEAVERHLTRLEYGVYT